MREVTIVIPNYNGMAYIEQCLNSLRKQSVSDFLVIVVDNGSADGSRELIEQCYTEVEILKLSENYGFCKAVNEGIKHSKTPFVILLNNDTEVEETFVEELLKAIKRSKQIFSCSAKMLNYYDRDKIDDAGNFYCALGWAIARGKGKSEHLYDRYGKIFASCAGAAIYRASIFEEIGLFDERHFAYLEDVDIGYRARLYGYENRYVPNAKVYHIGSATTGTRYNKMKVKISARNNIYLIYKNMPMIQRIINLPFILIGIFIKQLFFIKKRLGFAYFTGVFQGLLYCRKENKVEFKWNRFPNYIKVQIELWNNIFKIVTK